MNHTTRRHPRTLEQAFGPNSWPIEGPFRRRRAMFPRLSAGAIAVALVGACWIVSGALSSLVR